MSGASFPTAPSPSTPAAPSCSGFWSGSRSKGDAYLLAGTAAVGAYTTFSTWMLETHRLGEDREPALLFANIVVSAALGLGAAALGRAIGARSVNEDCLKLTTYFGERDRTEGGLLADRLSRCL